MPLEMRTECDRCGRSLPASSEAYICSYEHTFCARCTWLLQVRCSECAGELLRRPRRSGGNPPSEPEGPDPG